MFNHVKYKFNECLSSDFISFVQMNIGNYNDLKNI